MIGSSGTGHNLLTKGSFLHGDSLGIFPVESNILCLPVYVSLLMMTATLPSG